MKLTLTLSEKEVENAVKFYLERVEDYSVKSIKLRVENVSTGIGPMETTGPGFRGAECEVERN